MTRTSCVSTRLPHCGIALLRISDRMLRPRRALQPGWARNRGPLSPWGTAFPGFREVYRRAGHRVRPLAGPMASSGRTRGSIRA